jgi:hypothetical protein
VGYAKPEIAVEGSNVIIFATYRLAKPRQTELDLSKKGLTHESAKTLRVFWKNPDGTMSELAKSDEYTWGGKPIPPKSR